MNPSSETPLANSLSCSVFHPFDLWMLSFSVAKQFSWMEAPGVLWFPVSLTRRDPFLLPTPNVKELWCDGAYGTCLLQGVSNFPCGLSCKESTCNVGDLDLIPGLGRSPGEGKGYPLQYSGLENPMPCIVHGVAESRRHWVTFTFTHNLRLGVDVFHWLWGAIRTKANVILQM